MKLKYITALSILLFTTSCIENKKEFDQKRIHLERIEVGRSINRSALSNELDEAKRHLNSEENKLERINSFHLGRSKSAKEKQVEDQSNRIRETKVSISRIENEISLTNLRETFDFQNTPEGVVQYLFKSARVGDLTKLRYLCDPYGQNDSDTKRMCFLEMQTNKERESWISTFKNGRIIGEPIINKNNAEIEIAIGVNSDRLEKIKLIQRIEVWYLYEY